MMLKLLSLAAVPLAAALYDDASPVVVLTKANWDENVKNSEGPWLVEFYASWCGHCKALKPEYEKAAKALKGVVNLGATEDQELMASNGVQGFPTIKWYGEDKAKPSEYDKGRTAKAFIEFVMEKTNEVVMKKAGLKVEKKEAPKAAATGSADGVVELTDDNFQAEVLDYKGVVFVKFFAPWCGHCKSMAADYVKLAKKMKGKVKIAELDATVHTAMAKKYDINGYPYLKLFKPKGSEKEIVEYESGRNTDAMAKWLGEQTGQKAPEEKPSADGKVKKAVDITDSTFEDEVLKSKEPAFVKFYAPWCGHCKNMAADWDKLAKELHPKVRILSYDATANKTYGSKYGVQGFPTIKLFKFAKEGATEKTVVDYQGGRAKAAFQTWLKTQTGEEGSGGSAEPRKAEEESGDGAMAVGADNWDKEVMEDPLPVFVKFYAPWCGHCKAMAPTWDEFAQKMKGKVKVVKLDATVHGAKASEYGANGYPTLKLFVKKGDKKEAVDFNGGRNIKAFADFCAKEAGIELGDEFKEKEFEGDVAVLTDDNFQKVVFDNDPKEPVFVKFYAPWCGHCKSMAPTWSSIATKLKNKVKIAKLDSTVHGQVSQKYGVNGYPTIKMFVDRGSGKKEALDYDGGRDEASLIQYASKYYSVEAKQLLTQDQVDKTCTGSTLCVISFLPHGVDSTDEERAKYLDIYNEAAKSAGGLPAEFLWSEGGVQFEFEEKLNLGFGFPAIVAVQFKKQIFVTMRGSYTEQNVRKFITGLAAPKHLNTLPKNLPKINKQTAWVRPANLKVGAGLAEDKAKAEATEKAKAAKANGGRKADEDFDEL